MEDNEYDQFELRFSLLQKCDSRQRKSDNILEEIARLSKKLREIKLEICGLAATKEISSYTVVSSSYAGYNYFDSVPGEILQGILGHLTSPLDLVNVCQASVRVNKILNRIKPRFLFPRIFPSMYQFLGKWDILRCREVCKDWKMGVDDFVQQLPFMESLNSRGFSFGYFLQTIQDINSFIHGFETSGPNPFVGRHLIFQVALSNSLDMLDRLREGQTYWRAVSIFLLGFGKHLWTFEFHVESYFNEMSTWATDHFVVWLRSSRHTRKLIITGKCNGFSEQTLKKHMRILRSFNLPELPLLSHLELDAAPGYMSRLLFLKFQQQLKVLKLLSTDFDHATGYSSNGVLIYMPCLEQLQIKIAKNHWTDLSKLCWVQCPLKKLHVKVPLNGFIQLKDVLKVYEHFNYAIEQVGVAMYR